MMAREREREVETPTQATPGVAVLLEEARGGVSQWIVLEDSHVPASGVERELALDAPLAVRVRGKKVGDAVSLSEGPGITRIVTIRDLVPKMTYRFCDVWDQWQYRFPNRQEVWMLRSANGPDEKPDFSSIFEFAKEQHRRQEEAERLYADKVIPIWLFGQAIGKAEIYAFGHVATTEGISLRCCAGTAEEYAGAVESMKASSEVVIDVGALTTLAMLNELGVLELLGRACIITPATIAAVRAFAEDAKRSVKSEGSMGANESGPLLFVASPETRQQTLGAAEGFRKVVEKCCRVIPCHALAELSAGDRKMLDQGIGPSALESAYGTSSSF